MANNKHLTVLAHGGLVTPAAMQGLVDIARRYELTFYCTTAQNLRLLGASEENIEAVKQAVLDLGLQLKTSGRFPVPKVCVGSPYCKLGLVDTFALADRIAARYGGWTGLKPKIKIALAGCPASCSGALLADIGIVATRKGYDLYVGGKAGPLPRKGIRVARALSEDEVLDAVGRLVEYHTAHTQKKQRMFKLLEEPDFPFATRN
jgi:NAD(P)H-nitrite reductase large subunit